MLPQVNRAFEGFSRLFIGAELDAAGDLLHPELLDRSTLDFTIDSLHSVDRYCVALNKKKDELVGKGLARTVLWGGAYVGEVIRRAAKVQYDWVDYDDYVAKYPDVVQYVGPREVPTYAFLCKPNGGMNLPLSKFLKCVLNGIEDSVHFHATAELASQFK